MGIIEVRVTTYCRNYCLQ